MTSLRLSIDGLVAEFYRKHLVRLVSQAVQKNKVDRRRFFSDQPCERGSFPVPCPLPVAEEGLGTDRGTYSRALRRKSKDEATTVAGSVTPRDLAATSRLPATARVAEQATVAGTQVPQHALQHRTRLDQGRPHHPGPAAPLLDPHGQVGGGATPGREAGARPHPARSPCRRAGRGGGQALQVAGQGAEAAAGGYQGGGLVVGVAEVLEGGEHGPEVIGQGGEGGRQGGVAPATGLDRTGVEVSGELLVPAPEATRPLRCASRPPWRRRRRPPRPAPYGRRSR